MRRRLALLGVTALTVAGCVPAPTASTVGPAGAVASQSPSPEATSPTHGSASPAIVPWSPATAAPSPAPTPSSWPTGPACRPDQLDTTAWLAYGGLGLGGFTIWNDAAAPCSIGRGVAVSILDASGRPLPVSTKIASLGPMCGGTGGQCPPPGPTAPPWIFMPPSAANAQNGGDAANVAWTNWCGPQPAQPLALQITLGDGTLVRTPGITVMIPACANASKPSVLEVTPMEIGGNWPTEPPAIPADELKASLEFPEPATPGQPLHYVLVLTNLTSSAIELTPCPTYQERLGWKDGTVVEEHVLNCVAVGPIAPGQSVRFAMVIDAPASLLPTSEAGIVWILDPNYSEGFIPPLGGPAVKAPVSVVLP